MTKTAFALICAFILFGIGSQMEVIAEKEKYAEDNVVIRDYQFEAYCDSVYEVDPDYYFDVITESNEYQNYIANNGKWWDD